MLKSVLFTICSILVLDTFVAPAIIGVSSITVWIITSVVFFIPYGLLSAELGSAYPDNGGISSWVNRAFGERASVLTGWYYWINVAFWMPAVFVAFSYWFSYAFLPDAPSLLLAAIAAAMCWVIVWVGVRGVELSVAVSNIAAVCKVAILLLFGFLGIAYGVQYGLANDFSLIRFIPSINNTTQYVAAIVYNLLGFELIGSIGSQIEDPGRTIPKMTVLSGAVITALYVFGTFGILSAVPAAEVDTVDGFYFALKTLCSVFGPAGEGVFRAVIAIAMLTLVSNMITWTLGANETLSAAGLDARSKFLSHRHKRFGTSDRLYYIMGVIATLLIAVNFALSGNANEIFWTILSFSTLIFLLPYLFMFPAAVKLRFADKGAPRPYRIGGGNAGIVIAAVLCELCVLISIYFLVADSEPGFPRLMLLFGTLLTTVAGFWLYASGRQEQ